MTKGCWIWQRLQYLCMLTSKPRSLVTAFELSEDIYIADSWCIHTEKQETRLEYKSPLVKSFRKLFMFVRLFIHSLIILSFNYTFDTDVSTGKCQVEVFFFFVFFLRFLICIQFYTNIRYHHIIPSMFVITYVFQLIMS